MKKAIKPRMGRPPADGAEDLARHLVMLDPLTAAKLRVLGDGNLSAGIRLAAKRVRAP